MTTNILNDGRVDLFWGTASGLSIESYQFFSGTGLYQRFGSAVSLCDLNGDGYDDMAVGVPGFRYNNGITQITPGAVVALAGAGEDLPANRAGMARAATSHRERHGAAEAHIEQHGP